MDELGKALAQIAGQLGVTANRLWPEVVWYTFWTSVAWAILDPIAVIALIWSWIRLWRWAKPKIEEGGYDNFEQIMAMLFYSLFAGAVIVLIVATYPSVIASALDPEGATVYHLLGH
jgi:Na+/H+ antiporter NhaC